MKKGKMIFSKKIVMIMIFSMLLVMTLPVFMVNSKADGKNYTLRYEVLNSDEKTAQLIGYDGDISGEILEIPDTTVINGETYLVTKIGDNAFKGCDSLEGELVIPNSVEVIGKGAFAISYRGSETSDNKLVLGNSIKSIGDEAFLSCDFRFDNMELPETLKSLGDSAFLGNSISGMVYVPDGIESIGNNAFPISNPDEDAEFSISLPCRYEYYDNSYMAENADILYRAHSFARNGAVDIEAKECLDCGKLNIGYKGISIIVNDAEYLSDRDFGPTVMVKDGNRTLLEHVDYELSYNKVSGYCYDQRLIIKGINHYGGELEKTWGVKLSSLPYNFYYEITDNVKKTVKITGYETDGCYYNRLCIPDKVVIDNIEYTVTEIGKNAFNKGYSNDFGKELILPDSIEIIGENAFYGCVFEKIEFGNNVKKIDSHAFKLSPNLSYEFEVPPSVQDLNPFAFTGTDISKKAEIILPCGFNKGNYDFSFCSVRVKEHVIVNAFGVYDKKKKYCPTCGKKNLAYQQIHIFVDPVKNETQYANNPVVTVIDGEETLTLGEDYTVAVDKTNHTVKVTGINDYIGYVEKEWGIAPYEISYEVIDEEKRLAKIVGLEEYGDPYLYNLYIPEVVFLEGKQYRVTQIGENAFSNAYHLGYEVEIPDNIEVIGENAFSGCSNVLDIILPCRFEGMDSNYFGKTVIIKKHDFISNSGVYDDEKECCQFCGKKNLEYNGLDILIKNPQYEKDVLQGPEVTIKAGEKILKDNEDFSLEYVEKIEPCKKQSLVIKGMGNYCGTIQGTWGVDKADPKVSLPTDLEGKCFDELSSIKLEDLHFTWKYDYTKLLGAGDSTDAIINTYKAIYTPDDTIHYNKIEVDIPVLVSHDFMYSHAEETKTHNAYCRRCGTCCSEACSIKGKATCVKKATCEICKHGYYDENNHENVEIINAKKATSNEEGYTGDRFCADCNRVIEKGKKLEKIKSDTVLTYVISKSKVKIVNADKSEVAYISSTNKNAKVINVPSKVKIKGKTYTVVAINDNAFKNNKNATKIVIPASVKKLGKNIFKGLKKLKTVTIKSTKLTKKTVSKKAFAGLAKKTVIKVPKKKKKAYIKLFGITAGKIKY